MRYLGMVVVLGFVSLFSFAGDKPPVAALPPVKIDAAFEKARTPKELDEALLNDPQYQKAIKAALKAKADHEARDAKGPKIIGPTAAQSAREAFLKTLAE